MIGGEDTMMAFNRTKNKKGFSLMECVVALLLFSVITGAVLTVFSSSRNQMRRQNDKYKTELMAGNILSAYEGCNTTESFEKRMQTLGINLAKTNTFSKTIGTEGTGQYSFDSGNIPVAIPFSKITVKNDTATFRNEDDTADIVGFGGEYPDNKLLNDEVRSWEWGNYFDEAKKREPTEMTLSGKAYYHGLLSGSQTYDFTYKINEESVLLKMGSMSGYISKPASSFDKYLLENKYYLKCGYAVQQSGFILKTNHYRFQVYNIDNTPVQVNGNNLYYCISISGVTAALTCNANMQSVVGGSDDADASYFDFDNCTIKYYTGKSCPSYSSFSTELKNGKSSFSGKWYFMPWFVHENEGNIEPDCDKYVDGFDYYEYTPKENVTSNIYYALTSLEKNAMLLFNSDGELIFPYDGDTSAPVANLQVTCGFGNDGKRNTQALYNEMVFDKWYKRGEVPLWNVTKVRFIDNASGISRIVFYGKPEDGATESEYITFNYSSEDHDKFIDDRAAVLNFNGNFSKWYNYEKTYSANELKTVDDPALLEEYKTSDKLKEITFGKSTEKENLVYYTVSRSTRASQGKYTYTYTYYSYEVTVTKDVKLTGYKENSRTLVAKRNGEALTCNESINDAATVETTYTYSIKQTASNKTTTLKDRSTSEPKNPPDAVKGGTKVTSLSNYKSSTTILNNYKKGKPTTSQQTVNGIVGGSTYNELPENINWKWKVISEPIEAALHTSAELTSFIGNEGAYDVQVGENVVFSGLPSDFVIAANGVSVTEGDSTYDIIGAEMADIDATTYFITWKSGDISLISVVTYSNYTKTFTVDGVEQSQEPKIMIWSMPTEKLPTDIKTITGSEYDQYLYSEYRKG